VSLHVPFVYELRKRKVPVGTQETVALAQALGAGLHDSSLTGFYHVARALLVHSEAHLDAFDEAFLAHFKHIEQAGLAMHSQLLEWLREAAKRRGELSDEERAVLDQLSEEDLLRQLEERLREQTERHDGGSKWVGTGGTSPFGHSGAHRKGVRVGGSGGGRQAILALADARRYRPYRSDVTLDVRQMAVALRKLRAFAREGGEQELDIEETIDATARNAGELEVVTRPPRRPNTRVVLLMDVGGSMDPYAHLVGRLFTAASRASHFKELHSYYFHNCVYGNLYTTESFRQPVPVSELLRSCGKNHKLIVVGDALMAPYELLAEGASYRPGKQADADRRRGIDWLKLLAEHFRRSVWLNPEPRDYWRGNTIESVADVFPMFTLTLDGLSQAVDTLTRGRGRPGGPSRAAG
jgi:uncharacterized protein